MNLPLALAWLTAIVFAWIVLSLAVSAIVLLWAYVLGLRIEQREAAERVERQLARVHPPQAQ